MDDIIEVLYKCILFRGLDKAQIGLFYQPNFPTNYN